MKNNMMKKIKCALPLATVLFLMSCGEQHGAAATDGVLTDTTVKDTLAAVQEPVRDEFLAGLVKEIQTGKDGYTAKVVTTTNDTVFATISHANLKDHTSYKTVKVGDSLFFKGDTFHVGTEVHMAVRYLK
jgi:hypothetical protein